MFQQTPLKQVRFHRTRKTLIVGVLSIAAILGGIFVSLQGTAQALTSSTINFQARLEGAGGAIAPDGFYNVEFKLYNDPSTGTNLWTEDYYDANGAAAGQDNRAKVVNGYVSVALGSQTAFPSTINWDQPLYLTMNIGGTTQTATPTYDGEMSPRLSLTAVPYAFRAGQLATSNAAGSLSSTLSILQPTVGNQTFQIADQAAAGTYNVCIQGAANAAGGCAAATGAAGYIQNQNTATQLTSNFWISGTGRADGGYIGNSLDTTAAGGTLQLGPANATTVNVGNPYGTTKVVISAGTLGVSIAAGGVANTIQIGNTIGAVAQTINIGNNTTASSTNTVNVGSTVGASTTSIKAGSGGINLTGNLTTNGSTVNTVLALGNFTTGGVIGTAANTVDAYTSITINQTTASQTLTLPNPTSATAGRVLYISNIGTAPFTLLNAPISNTVSATLVWNGSAWTYAGADASSILNQTSSTQTAGFKINGTATVGQLNVTAGNNAIASSGTGVFQLQNATNEPYFIGSTTATNLIGWSPTFEASAFGWNADGTGTGLAVLYSTASAANAYSGSKSLQVTTASGTANTGASEGTFTSPITTATQYTFSFYAKASGSNFSTLRAGMSYNGTLETACTLNSNSVLTTGFQRYSCTFTTGTVSGTPYVFIGTSDTTQNTLYIDDVQLIAGAITKPVGVGAIDILGVVSSPLTIQTNSDSTSAFKIQNAAGTTNLFNADTLNNTITVGGNLVTAGSTLNTSLALGNFAAGGSIGTAAATVDKYTSFTINQTTAGQTLTIPNPTTTTAGRVVYISNVGTTPFTLLNAPISNTVSATLIWNGAAWTYAGADASSILNQTSATQSAGFTINGTATVGQLTSNGGIANTGDFSTTGTKNYFNVGVLQVSGTNGVDPLLTTSPFMRNNLVSTAGFENGNQAGWVSGGAGTGLSISSYGTARFSDPTATAPNVYDGLYSLLVTTGSGVANTGARYTGFSPAMASTTQYTLSFYAKASGSNFNTLRAGIAYNGSTETPCTLSSTAVVTTGFNRYSCTFTSGTVTSPYLFIGTSDTTQNNFYVDDVQLQQASVVQTYNPGYLMLQGRIVSPVAIQNTSDSTTAFQIQNAAGTSNLFTADTLNNTITIGGNLVTSGSTLNTALALGNFATGGSIGTAAATVDKYTSFTINQTTAGQTLTIPSPTTTTAGRVVYISNIGSAAFNMLGSPLASSVSATIVWNGTAWTFAGADGSSILNQNTSTQTGTFNISGSATAGSFSTAGNIASSAGTLTVGGTGNSSIMGALGLGTTNPQTGSAITIQNGSWISALDSAGTGYVNMFQVNAQNQIQVGAALSVDGGIILPTNGGQLTLSDLPIDSTAASGSKQSYTLRVGSTNALTVYGEADGSGNAQNVRVAIGSSIAPAYTLDVAGDINLSTGSVLRINGTQICSSTGCTGSGGGATGVTLQASTPGTADTGNFNITGTGIAGSLQATSFDTAAAGTLTIGGSNATTVNIANNAAAHTVNVATGAGVQNVTIGSTNTSSSTIIQGGTGAIRQYVGPSGTFGSYINGTNVFGIDTNGRTIFKPLTDDLSAFKIQNAAGTGTAFAVDSTGNGGILTGNQGYIQGGTGGISTTGGLTFSGTATTSYVTPLGTSLATKINVPNYNPGAFNQIIALGLPSTANANARAITLLDARTGTHQPTLAVLSPDENQIFGLSWEGSNTIAQIKTSSATLGLQNSIGIGLTVTGSTGNQLATIGLSGLTNGQLQFSNATNNNNVALQASSVSTSYITNLPTAIGVAGQCLTVASVASTTQTLGYSTCGGAGGANSQLSNLSGTVAINLSLLSAADNTLSLGSAANVWQNTYTGALDAGTTTTALTIGTVNASSVTVGRSASPTTIVGSGLALNAPTITTNATSLSLFNTTAATVNAFGATTLLNLGSTSGVTNILNQTLNIGGSGPVTIQGAGNAGVGFGSAGYSAASSNSGATILYTGQVSGATSNSGTITINSGNSTTSGNTGTVTIASGNAASGNSGAISIDSGTAGGGTAGTVMIGTANASGVSIGRLAVVATVVGDLTIGSAPGSGTTFTNNGSTVNSTLALANFTSGGSIGTAAATVDKYTSISVAQTTGSQTLTLPSPTAASTYGRMLYLSNIGTSNFTLLGTLLKPGATASLTWANTNGAASWQNAGADGNGILNQNTSTQTADFNISGTGTAATFQSTSFSSTGAVSLQAASGSNVNINPGANGGGSGTLNLAVNAGTLNIGNGSNNVRSILVGNTGGSQAQTVTIGNNGGTASFTTLQGSGGVVLQTNNSAAGVTVKSVTNSATAFQIQNSGGVSLLMVDTATSTITFGTATNNMTLSAGSFEPVLNGAARHLKSIGLAPEYAGGVLDALGDSAGSLNCALNSVGTMTSGFATGVTGINNQTQSYYKWTTAAGSSQCYDIVVQVPIPGDFSVWANNPITANGYTSNTSTGLINLEARDSSGTVETGCNFVNVTPGSATTWSANNTACALAGSYSANGYMTLRIRLTSPSGGDVRIGNLTLNYLSKY